MLHRLKEERINHINVASRGLFAYPGARPDPAMVNFLDRKRIRKVNHKSAQLKRDDIEWSDLICVMEKGHQKIIESLWPGAKGKIRHLASFIKDSRFNDDIIDPIGKSPYHYRLVQAQIFFAIDGLIKWLKEKGMDLKNDKNKDRSY